MDDFVLPREAAAPIEQDMRRWLERAVIGLNLCPFAKAVHAKGQVHYAVSSARDGKVVLDHLAAEALELARREPSERDTTLLVVPLCLDDFHAFNGLLGRAERVLRRLGLEGVLQIASFHPAYQFAGTEPEDVTNCTNQAPYPTLHLLREDSIARAVEAFPDAEAIYARNMETLRRLGAEGWAALGVGASAEGRRKAAERKAGAA